MPAVSQLIETQTLRQSIQNRLWAGGSRGQNVVWQDRGASVVVYPPTLGLRFESGWMITKLDLETDQTGRETLELVFFLGRGGQGDGLVATTTLEGADPSGLRTRWGEPVQAAIWDGVLDEIEATLVRARQHSKSGLRPLVIAGFRGSDQGLHLNLEEASS